ncbi:hypothetical protein ACTXPE_07675 [Psychrobacter celer]|uniref:hypothetical protein n=1 Tax=Psychrobacter celer TaxID=306572 RepID=UPI003FD61F16
MKILILIICFMSLLSCDATDISKPSIKNENIASEQSSAADSSEKANSIDSSSEKQKTIKKVNFSAQSALNSIQKSSDTRKLVYLIHPTEEILVYCYQENKSECYIKGQYKGKYFEYDLTEVENRNVGTITINEIQSAKTTPTEWMSLTENHIQVRMTTQIIMNSKRYTSYEPLIIFFDERGVFWR